MGLGIGDWISRRARRTPKATALVDAATAIRDDGDFSSLDSSPDFEKWLAL